MLSSGFVLRFVWGLLRVGLGLIQGWFKVSLGVTQGCFRVY